VGVGSLGNDEPDQVKAVLLSDEARADALEAFVFYEGRRPGLGLRFRDHLDLALTRIREDPTRYPIVYREVRRRLVDRFPYGVCYREYPDVVLVIAVMHGRRDPGRWRRRASAHDV